MNWANRLTLSRIILAFIFMAFLFLDNILGRSLALMLFLLACVTDWYDGKLARDYCGETDFGRLMDPLADKILISAAFICFVQIGEIHVPAWMVVIIISREFSITGLRILAANKGRVLSAERCGKHKTISQMVAIFSVLVFLLMREIAFKTGVWSMKVDEVGRIIIYVLMFITVVLTVISGLAYLNKNKQLFLET